MKLFARLVPKAPCVIVLGVILFCANETHLCADVTLPVIFGDNMVMQADAKIPVWGWAAPGENISVMLGASTQKTQASTEGKWQVAFAPLPASFTPLTLSIIGTNHVEFKDVLIGEVWLCSGQSNMYFALEQDANGTTELPQCSDPMLRLFKVPELSGLQPNKDLKGSWKACTPESAKRFSAVAYYFGKQLRADLKRPVGLIMSCYGGSIIQAWMSMDAMQMSPPFSDDIAIWQKLVDNYAQNKQSYPQRLADFNTQSKQWQEEVGQPFKIASAAWETQAQQAKASGQPIPPRPVLSRQGPPRLVLPDGDQSTPTALFNGMIHPLIPYAIKGVLWYQGEGNTHPPHEKEYYGYLSRMVPDWRQKWGEGDFPFIVVQLPLFHDPAKQPVDGNWPYVREAQLKALSMPQTGMAVALDQGDPRNVHPIHKGEVGRRASLAARQVAYGEKIVASGPLYQSMKIEGNQVHLTFSSVGSGLSLGPTSGAASPIISDQLSGFAIAGADKKWVSAEAKIDGDAVVVSSPAVPNPVAVRYAWNDNPPCNLYNKEGLPASLFRTDDWDQGTP